MRKKRLSALLGVAGAVAAAVTLLGPQTAQAAENGPFATEAQCYAATAWAPAPPPGHRYICDDESDGWYWFYTTLP